MFMQHVDYLNINTLILKQLSLFSAMSLAMIVMAKIPSYLLALSFIILMGLPQNLMDVMIAH